jgi:hypothetical protein
MNEKWIGEEVNTSGTYSTIGCKELMKRSGGPINPPKLYAFRSAFSDSYNDYYISDEEAIVEIENFIHFEQTKELREYLYNLVIQRFGIIQFLKHLDDYAEKRHKVGRAKGRREVQLELRKTLGLGGF